MGLIREPKDIDFYQPVTGRIPVSIVLEMLSMVSETPAIPN